MNITEFRNKYPEYNEVSDEELADRLWNKHYKSQGVSKEEFNRRFLGSSGAQPQVPTGSQPQVPSGPQPQAPSGPQPSWRDYARAVMATRIKQQIAPIELGLGAFDWATKKLLSRVPEEWTADQIDWLLNHGNLPPRPGEGVSERIYGPRGVLGPTTQVRKWAEEKGIDREKVRKGIGPRALASIVPSAIEFTPTLAAGAGEDVIASLGGASEGKISESLPRPSAKRMGANFIAPYVEAIRTRSFDPILKHALEDPIQTFFDAAIAFGVVKGVFNGEMAVKTRVKVRKAWEKEIKNAAKEGGEAPGIGRLEEILVEHGVPIESVREAASLMDNIPAYKRTGIKERPSEPPPEPPPEPVPEPPIPKAPEPKPGNLLDLASKTVRPEPPSILELAQRAIVPEAKGVKKRAETRLKEVREGRKVPDMSRVKVIGGKTESAVNKIVEGALEGKKFEPKAVLVKRHGGVLPDKISKATAIVPEFGSKTEAVTYGERLARGRVSGITANNAERVIEAKKHGLKIKIGKLKKAGKTVEVVNAEQQLRRLDDVMDGIIEGRKKMKPKELKRVMGEVEKARKLDALRRKLKEEKGAITFSRKTEVEKRYDRAMKNLRRAVYAEGRRSETAAESKEAAEAHVNGTASLRNAGEFDKAIGKPPKKARKVRDKAMAEEFWVPEEHSPNSEAAITYVKSKDFKKYVEKLPEMGELKPKDVRGKAGVVDVRESGQFVHTSFARQFVDVVDRGNGQISVKVKASDIPAHWAHTLDPARVIEWSDGKFGGELAKKLLRPARDTIRARNHYIADWDSRINDIVSKYRIKSTKDRKMLGRVLLGEVKKPPKRFVEAAKAMRELYDKGLEDMNAAREKQGRKLIPRREDFGMPWVIETTFRDKLFGSKSTPDGILKKAEPPDFIRPNSPFNPRELPREAQYDRYVKEKDAIKVAMDYGRTVAKDVFNTNVIHNNKVHARFLNDIGLTNLANAIMQWTTEVFAGRKHAIDRVIEGLGPVVSGAAGVQRRLKAAKMRTLFALNIPWNVFVQTSSSAMLVPRVGFKNSVKGLDVFVSPKLRRFVEDTYTHVMKKGVRPEVAEFRGTVSEFRRLNKTGRLNSVADTLNFFTKWLEKVLTDHAIAAGYFEGKARGLKGRDLLEFASDVGAKVHSMYNFEDLPALLRSKDMTASFPLQTFYWETLNNLREIGGRRGAMAGISKKNMAVRLLKWYATMVAINALTSHFIDRNVWTPISFVPMGPHIASLLGIEVEGGRYDAFKPTAVQWLDDVRRAARNAVYYDDWTSTRKLVNEWLVPGGVAVERMMGTVEAMQQGGRVRSADKRTLFRIPKGEVGKSMMLGPWGTSEAKKLKHERDRTLIGNILGGKIPKNVKNRKLREVARERRK